MQGIYTFDVNDEYEKFVIEQTKAPLKELDDILGKT